MWSVDLDSLGCECRRSPGQPLGTLADITALKVYQNTSLVRTRGLGLQSGETLRWAS
jgi:hypothetical protein